MAEQSVCAFPVKRRGKGLEPCGKPGAGSPCLCAKHTEMIKDEKKRKEYDRFHSGAYQKKIKPAEKQEEKKEEKIEAVQSEESEKELMMSADDASHEAVAADSERDEPAEQWGPSAAERALLRRVETLQEGDDDEEKEKPLKKKKDEKQSEKVELDDAKKPSAALPTDFVKRIMVSSALKIASVAESFTAGTSVDLTGTTLDLAHMEGFDDTLWECLVDQLPALESGELSSPYTRLAVMVSYAALGRMSTNAAARIRGAARVEPPQSAPPQPGVAPKQYTNLDELAAQL